MWQIMRQRFRHHRDMLHEVWDRGAQRQNYWQMRSRRGISVDLHTLDVVAELGMHDKVIVQLPTTRGPTGATVGGHEGTIQLVTNWVPLQFSRRHVEVTAHHPKSTNLTYLLSQVTEEVNILFVPFC